MFQFRMWLIEFSISKIHPQVPFPTTFSQPLFHPFYTVKKRYSLSAVPLFSSACLRNQFYTVIE